MLPQLSCHRHAASLGGKERLESSAEKVSQEGSGESYITHGSSSMRG